MRKTRFALASLLATVVMALIATPAAAQASATSELINQLNGKMLYLAIPITVLVEAILIYTVIKFRNSESAKPTKENRRLEITWTITTAIILLFVGVASYGVLANENVTYEGGNPIDDTDDGVVVQADAFQWGWNMTYPEHGYMSAPSGENGPRVVRSSSRRKPTSGAGTCTTPRRVTSPRATRWSSRRTGRSTSG